MSAFALVVVFLLGVAGTRWFLLKPEKRSHPPGVADLVGWAHLVAPGVVLQKDGSLLAAWRYRGPDVASATVEEINTLSEHVKQGFHPFADGWMFHVDAFRRPAIGYAPEGAFPDPTTRTIDWARRQMYQSQGQKYETECFLAATFKPDPEKFSRLARLLMQGGERRMSWDDDLAAFVSALATLEDRLSARLTMERLPSDQLLAYLHECLTGLSHPVLAPPHGSYLNQVLCDQPILGGNKPMVGQLHIIPVAVHGYPPETWPSVLDTLTQQPFAYRWSTRFIPLGRETAEKKIRVQQVQWFQKRKGAGTWVSDIAKREKTAQQVENDKLFEDGNALEMAASIKGALAESSAGAVRHCHYNGNLIVMEPTAERAEAVAKHMVKVLNDLGLTAAIEDYNAFEAFLGTIPGDGFHNLRRHLLSSHNITDMLPITSVWPGFAESPSPFYPAGSPALMWTDTAGSTPFRVNLFSNPPDVGHTLIIGGTGAGKTTLAGAVVAQFQRYPRAQTFIFDKNHSSFVLTAAAGGQHYDIVPGGDALKFQPLARIDDPAERAWAAEWLEVALALQGLTLTAKQRGYLADALELVAEMGRRYRTITSLLMQVAALDPQIGEALKPYTIAGDYALLDGDEDGLEEGSYQCFEMHRLMEAGDKITVPVLLYLFHRIEGRLDGRPTLVMIEEAWAPLANSLFAGRINEWLLTWRKRNAAVVLIAQSLMQLHALPNRQVIIDSCPTRLLLPNPQAATEDASPMYRGIGLNEKEITVLARARQKRDYYYSSPAGSRLFELRLGPVELAFLSTPRGTSMQEMVSTVQRLAAEHGPAWPGAWLKELGHHEAAERFYDYLGGAYADAA